MFTAFWRVFVTMVTASTAVTPAQLCQCFHMCCGKYCGKVLVCLMLLLTVCSASNSNKDQRTCNRGTITPAEPYFLEGEDIVLMCNRKKGPSKHLTFVRGQNSTLVPDKYIQQFNDTAIKMVIPNITAEDIDASSPFTQYRCIHTGNKKKRCYDNVYVRLEYPLRKPVDLKCWDYDFNEMMCNWSLAVEYHNPGDINTTCEYYNASNDETSVQSTTGSFWEQCPNMVNTSCHWDPLSYPAPISTIDVRVTVRNTRRNVSEVIYQTFNKFDIVEPGPVTELKGKPLQNRCVELQWKPSSPTRSYVFIVTYRSTCSPELEKRVYYYKKKFNDSVVICDLVPYTLYTFSVKGRVIEDSGTYIERGYWSKPEVVKVRTDKDVLDVNPVTTPGLYEISADSLSLYWTPMKDCDLHDASDNVSYILSLNNVTKSVKHPAFMAEIDIHVPRMSMLNVTVQASNSVGSPPSNRDVTIFPALDDLSPSELIVQYNKTIKDCVTSAEIVVREKLSKFSDVSHTLVWCKGTQDCQEPVIFEKLKNATAFVFPGNLCDADYRYGLVTHGYLKGQSEITDTGIHWELCIYQSGKEIDKPLGNVRLWEVEEGTGFTVEWTHYNCKEMKVFITHYNVEYCVSGDKDDCSCKSKNTVNVSRHNTSYTSTNDLLAGSHVCVWVRGVCSTGKGPANEKPKTLNIGEADSIVLKVIAVVLSLLSFVILMIGLLLFIRKYYRKMKDRGKITLPEIDSNHDNMQGQYDRLLYNETSGMDTSESVPNNYSSAGTTSTRVPNTSEGQPLLYYDCESSGDIDGYKQPNDFEAIESGYQEEALTSENSLEVGSEDQEEESQKTLEEQKTAESLANVDMVDRSDVAMKDEPDQNRNIVKSQSELQLDQVNDCNHKENIELQTMTSNCANHFSSASILVPQELEDETELTSIPFEMFIDQEVTSEDLYKEFGSGSTFFYESGVEESNENDKENGKADQLFVKESDSSGGRSYPQDRSESVDGSIDVSDRSDNESGSVNLSGQTSAIACNLTAASEPLEQNSSEKSINGSMSDLSEKDEAETTSDIDGTDNNLNESYSSSVIYKRSEDVRGMSESEDDTGYKRSEDVFSMSESEDDIEGVSGDSADQTKSTDVLKSCDQHVMNMEKLENKNNIVNGLIGKNGFISSVPNLIDNRNSISSGSDSSIEHQSTSSCHGNSGSSSGVKSYVTADVKHNLQEVDRKYNSDGLKPGEKSKKSPYRNGKKIPDVAMS